MSKHSESDKVCKVSEMIEVSERLDWDLALFPSKILAFKAEEEQMAYSCLV